MKSWKIGAVLPIMFMIFLGTASISYGAVPHGVKYTVHNLGTTGPGPFISDDTRPEANQVCIFCHTPHNAAPGKRFLWNRSDTVSTVFMPYTVSPSLTTVASSVNVLGEMSKLCMSCHDGVTALNAMANPSTPLSFPSPVGNELGDPPNDDPFGEGEWKANIGQGTPGDTGTGGNLTNDHPISFSYSAAQGLDPRLKSIASAKAEGLAFWGSTENIECVTCHDPHINYGMRAGFRQYIPGDPDYGGNRSLAPFLRRTNSSSGLCFACHDK